MGLFKFHVVFVFRVSFRQKWNIIEDNVHTYELFFIPSPPPSHPIRVYDLE